jgi:tight adherence protein C
MNPLLLIPLAAVSAGILIVAAWLMLRVSNKDEVLAYRIGAARGQWRQIDRAEAPPRAALLQPLHKLLAGIGHAVLESGVLPGRTRLELQQTLSSSGLRGPSALSLFLGAKLVLVLTLPVAAWALGGSLDLAHSTRLIVTGVGFVAGLLAPDTIVRRIRRGYLSRLEDGLPDALDLMVICAQAGLSLEPAISRVAAEMRLARPEVCAELEQTVRELEIMADAQAALGNLAQRTGLPTLQRLVSTLVQTMQYGTPLTDALRNLSAEVRQQALTRFEARAARLSVILTLPMILFILPCVFIVVGGPAAIQVMKTFGN